MTVGQTLAPPPAAPIAVGRSPSRWGRRLRRLVRVLAVLAVVCALPSLARQAVIAEGRRTGAAFIEVHGIWHDEVVILGTTTLAADKFYDVLSVSNGGTLKTAGFRVYAKTSFTVNTGGVVSNNGTLPTGAPAGTIGGGSDGGAAGNVNGTGFAGASSPECMGGAGGTGGTSTPANKAGGAGGTCTVMAANECQLRSGLEIALGVCLCAAQTSAEVPDGGSGGGGGGGSAGNNGGRGGGGGGAILIASPTITVADACGIQAKGAAGEVGQGGGAGGGGGGGGGHIKLIGTTLPAASKTCATGGAAGANGSPAASAGADGTVVTVPN